MRKTHFLLVALVVLCPASSWAEKKVGSEQESDKEPISRGFPENHEFGFGGGHALSLEEQVA